MAYPLKESRDIQLCDQAISYTLVRRKRRTIGFKVDYDGLTVSAPPREPYNYLEQLIVERAAWIVTKLEEMEARRQPQRTWQNGERLLLLGDDLELNLYRSNRRAEPIRCAGKIWVGVPDTRCTSRAKAGWPMVSRTGRTTLSDAYRLLCAAPRGCNAALKTLQR